LTAKQITIALSAWQTMEQAVRDKVAEIKRLEAEAEVWRDNLGALWAALRMIRDAVEEIGPIGAVPSEESILPEPHHEAEAIIKGIQAIALGAHPQR
jgi:hypothetical protein